MYLKRLRYASTVSVPSTCSEPSDTVCRVREVQSEKFADLAMEVVVTTATRRPLDAKHLANARAGLMWPCAGNGITTT